jgi:hypothetical protein
MFICLWILLALQRYYIWPATYRVMSSFIEFYRVVAPESCKNLVFREKSSKFALKIKHV